MKIHSYLTLLSISILASAFAVVMTTSWNISNDYTIKFSGTSAEGTFKGLEGTVIFDPENLSAANMDVEVATNTISTGNNTKDKHARGSSWFDVEKYPSIKFKSSSFSKSVSGYEVIGNLTMHGVTKEIKIPFTFSETNGTGLFEGEFTVSRDAYGIEGPFLAFTVGDEFKVNLRVPVERN